VQLLVKHEPSKMCDMVEAIDADLAAGIRLAFRKHGLMATIGATLQTVEVGRTTIRLPFSKHVTQHDDFVHAGAITAIVDTACGCAAMTLAPQGTGVLTVEYKVNFLAPARGKEYVATGQELKAGKNLTICQGSVECVDEGAKVAVAVMLATMMIMKKQA